MNDCSARYTVYPTSDVAAGSFYGNGFRGKIEAEFDPDVIKLSVNAKGDERGNVEISIDRPEWMAIRAFIDAKIAESDAREIVEAHNVRLERPETDAEFRRRMANEVERGIREPNWRYTDS